MAEELKPKSIKVDLSPRAREIVDGLREDTGVPNTQAMERLLEWFASIDRKFRLAILNRDEATRAEMARLVLSEWAVSEAAGVDLSRPPSSFRDAVAAQRKLLDLIEQIGIAHEDHIVRSKKKKG